jgi:6-phosphofructokinase 1
MKRIAILTAGGDTPALNATIYGAVTQANERNVEVLGLIRGFDALFDTRLPHVRLNPLWGVIPELDPNRGGTILGASRTYVNAAEPATMSALFERLERLGVDGLICVGGDGTMNGLQPLCEKVHTVLAPKTIDNDLGLNYPGGADDWLRIVDKSKKCGFRYELDPQSQVCHEKLRLDQIVNYVTPGFATAVFVSASGVQRVRTTAESHRRIAVIEVMGRQSGFIALGSAYGQPDIILIPEVPVDVPLLIQRVKEVYDRQQNVVIVCGEGIVDARGTLLGETESTSSDPAGNIALSGAAEQLRRILINEIGDDYFRRQARKVNADRSIFTRKVGHTQRGGRPVSFDRFHAAMLGGKAVEMLLEGQNNAMATLTYDGDGGFCVDSCSGNSLRDKWGVIHARQVHRSFYDAKRLQIAEDGINYLLPIFTSALGVDDTEHLRQTLFDSGNLLRPYHSINRDMQRRIEYLD